MTYEQQNQTTGQPQASVTSNEGYHDGKNNPTANRSGHDAARYWGMDEPTFSMLLHLSSFLGIAIPFAGIVLPVVMWATNKNESAVIDAHGKNVINWIISFMIYAFISAILCMVLIGIPMLFALGICSLVFTIMGAVKANHGTVWAYPMSIRFFK
jgi:uncharacterized protein